MVRLARVVSLTVLVGVGLLAIPRRVAAEDLLKEFYYVSLDANGVIFDGTFTHKYLNPTIETSRGDGLGWIYYPVSDRYLMWFHNGPFYPEGSTDITFYLFLAVVDPSKPLSCDISVGWTTEQWTNSSTPPMPSDMPTLDDERRYTYRGRGYTQTNANYTIDSTYEPQTIVRARNYRPEWVYVSVSGSNFFAWRWIGRDNSGASSSPSGACCNPTTGQCYQTTSGTCAAGYQYLGDGTTCDACTASSYDYGDAPASYGVLAADNGARHLADSGLTLGQAITADADGTPSPGADADGGDDGIQFLGTLAAGQSSTVMVTASADGLLNAWLDLNQDGDWADPDEQILVDEPITGGDNLLNVSIPSTAVAGTSYARFRLSSTAGLTPLGTAPDGEVEDYLVTVAPASDPNVVIVPTDPNEKLATLVDQAARWTAPGSAVVAAVAADSLSLQGPIVVDDWNYSGLHPVQGVRWWGTFGGWSQPTPPPMLPEAFQVTIWSANSTSQAPETMIWQLLTNQWTWAYAGQLQDPTGQQTGQSVFEFTVLLSQDEWFDVGSDLAGPYWLGIAAQYANPPQTVWRWVGRPHQLYDPAHRIQQAFSMSTAQSTWPVEFGAYALTTEPVEAPAGVAWDMSFELLTVEPPMPGTGAGPQGDLNGDGQVDTADLALLMQIVFPQ